MALAAIVETGPIPAIHGVVRWRRKDLVAWLHEQFGFVVVETTLGRGKDAKQTRQLLAQPVIYDGGNRKETPPRADDAPGAPAVWYGYRDLT